MTSAIVNRLFCFGSRIQNAIQVLPKLQLHLQSKDKTFGFNKDGTTKESWSNLSEKVNSQLREDSAGRLFAVVVAAGKQRKITQEDVIVLDQKEMQVEIGDKIVLNKVLMVGGSDFTVIGRPILKPDVVKIEATVIEKTTSHTKICFWYKRRKRHRVFKLMRDTLTYLRINEIKFFGLPDFENQKL